MCYNYALYLLICPIHITQYSLYQKTRVGHLSKFIDTFQKKKAVYNFLFPELQSLPQFKALKENNNSVHTSVLPFN